MKKRKSIALLLTLCLCCVSIFSINNINTQQTLPLGILNPDIEEI